MKNSVKIIFFVILLITSITSFSENYAILISVGKATQDDEFNNSEYWYDLFLAYEDLIIKEGYSHDKVYVFYGDGNDFTGTNYDRYKKSYHGWTEPITDYDYSYTTVYNQIGVLSIVINEDDNLLIRWMVGHGGASDEDNYITYNQNHNVYCSEQQVYDMFNQINNYKRRKIIWMTCHSGALVAGKKTFNNEKTTIITCCRWDRSCYGATIPANETMHAEFNYVITSSLYGKDQCGNTLNADYYNDNVISLDELYQEVITNSVINATSLPQIGDICPLASKIYIDENILLSDATLSGTHEYLVDNIKTQNDLIIPNNANITFAASKQIILKHGFHAKQGCHFHAYIGDIPCGSQKMLIVDNGYPYSEEYINEELKKDSIVNDISQKENIFKSYPNPFGNQTNILYTVKGNEKFDISIYNIYGIKLYSLINGIQPAGKYNLLYDTSNLPNGVYICIFSSKNRREVIKLLKY
jgi:hypothetical protein